MSDTQQQREPEARIEFSACLATSQADLMPTLSLPTQRITIAGLTMADRKRRNRSNLYQCKHDPEAAPEHGLHTHQRPAALAALNQPISWHYQRFLAANGWYATTAPPIYAFGIGDLTANPLRPSYNVSERKPLFFLRGEPLGKVLYSLLVCYLHEDEISFTILHEVLVGEDGALPPHVPAEIRQGLLFWAACPALLVNGSFSPLSFATLDYDARHWVGFPTNEKRKAAMWSFYRYFTCHDEWKKAVRKALDDDVKPPAIYHAAVGITDDDRLVIIHRIATPCRLAEYLASQGCRNGLLLDTGGSPFIWSNLPVSEGSILACSSDFRPNRGAVVFLAVNGERYNTKRATCRAI